MVNLINMIELKLSTQAGSYAERDVRKWLKYTAEVFMRYPFPDIYVCGEQQQGANVLDLIIDCVMEFNKLTKDTVTLFAPSMC